MVTAKEIAKKLGVSPSTVSLVLNNKPGIGIETRKMVKKALEELGYIERTPVSDKKQDNLHIIFYKQHGKVLDNPLFFSRLLEGVEEGARSYGMNLLVSSVNGATGEIDRQIKKIINPNTIGFILLATEMDGNQVKPFETLGIPFVILDNCFYDFDANYIVINNVQGAYKATVELLDNGHRLIGHLSSKVEINNFVERTDGYRKALRIAGIPYKREYTVKLLPSSEGAYEGMKRHLISGTPLPTSFFADNDIIAIGAMRALREAGVKVPEDISIIGFDGIPFGEMTEPPLSTIQVSKEFMGRLAIERLWQVIEGQEDACVKSEIATKLIRRSSVKRI